MKIKEIMSKTITKKAINVIILLIVTMISMTVVSDFATSPENYAETIQSIDDKKLTVMGVSASAVLASTTLAAVPGDATTPIANQIMEIGSYLLIVVCVLVLEKSLLTVMGYISFNILIPVSCVLMGVYTFNKREVLKRFALRLVILALAIVMIVPFSIKVSDMIYETNEMTIEQVSSGIDENAEIEETEKSESWLDRLLGKVKQTTADIGEKAKQILNGFVDAIAVFIIAYCVMPLIVVAAFIWVINLLFKTSIPMPNWKNKFGAKKLNTSHKSDVFTEQNNSEQ